MSKRDGQPLDLAEEILRGEPALAEAPRQRVAGGREPDAALRQPAEQRRDEHRVAGVVQLELVHAEQPLLAQRLDGGREAERADQVRDLDERPVSLWLRDGVPERGQQVGLADAEAAVEVETCATLGPPGPPSKDRPSQPRFTGWPIWAANASAAATAAACDGSAGSGT